MDFVAVQAKTLHGSLNETMQFQEHSELWMSPKPEARHKTGDINSISHLTQGSKVNDGKRRRGGKKKINGENVQIEVELIVSKTNNIKRCLPHYLLLLQIFRFRFSTIISAFFRFSCRGFCCR